MANRHVNAAVTALITTAVYTAYMLHLRVPAVITIRPRLTEVGFLTGVFSGRGFVYLFYHYPRIAFVVQAVNLFIIFNIMLYLFGE